MTDTPGKTGAPPKQRTDYPLDLVRTYEDRLSKPFFAVLTAAAIHDGNVKAMADTLSMISFGTIKSRLHRARKALAALIEEDADERREKREMEPGGLLAD